MEQNFFWYSSQGSESLDDYEPGGYHPVHLGDRYPIEEPRYQVFDKLGYGGFSTVWLAEDLRTRRMVALKIGIADTEYTNHELTILQSLPRSPHVLNILDSFTIVGPNGKHDALVTEVLLFARMVREIFPGKLDVKATAYEVLKGLAFLHKNGIVHGDLHLENIAFRVPRLVEMSADEWRENQLYVPSLVPVLPRDSERENSPSLPKYLVQPFSLDPTPVMAMPLDRDNDWVAVIADFGGAYRYPELSSKDQRTALAPLPNRPPESLLILRESTKYPEMTDSKWGVQSDVWSVACTIYEMQDGIPIFGASIWDEHDLLLSMRETIGPLPPYLCHLLNDPKPSTPEDKITDSPQLNDLLGIMLKYDPAQRPSAQELLEHPYFSQVEDHTGSTKVDVL